MHKKDHIGDILIIIAGIFWGSMGIFVRHLTGLGFSSIQIACLRLTLAGLIFAIILLIKEPKGFKISVRDVPWFLALGLVSILFFIGKHLFVCLGVTIFMDLTHIYFLNLICSPNLLYGLRDISNHKDNYFLIHL